MEDRQEEGEERGEIDAEPHCDCCLRMFVKAREMTKAGEFLFFFHESGGRNEQGGKQVGSGGELREFSTARWCHWAGNGVICASVRFCCN